MRNTWKELGALALLVALLVAAGCTERTPGGRAGGGAAAPPAIVSGPRAVVEEYLHAAVKADGDRMYGLLATSERDDETPQSLRETAADRYSPDTTWEVKKVEEQTNTSTVVVQLNGVEKVEPNPYRFTLTKEAGEWRIVQSPELHEDDNDIKIKID